MSQTASTNFVLPEPSQELIVSEPWTMDNYADDLMDELFADIDCVLDGSGNLSSRIVQAQPQLSLQKTNLLQIVPPPTIISPIGSAEQRRIAAKINTAGSKIPKTARTTKKPRRKIWRNFRQLLTVGAGLGLAIAAMNWAINSGLLNRLSSKSLQFALQEPALQQKVLEPQITTPTQAEIKADLVDYMLGALAIIEKQQNLQDKVSANNNIAAAPVSANQVSLAYANQPVSNLPAPTIANNTKPLPTRSTRVVERIYIPVYQAPQPMRYAPPSVEAPLAQAPTPLPPVTTASKGVAPKPSDNKAKEAAPVKAAKTKPPEKIAAFASIREITPLAVKTKPVNVRQVPDLPKMKEPATVAAPKQTAATSPALVQQEQKVAAVSPSSHILEGLLELGEQSAALFKVNGITRRIQIGENIGASGWTLVEVANGEAIIRRNGEVRSIFAGQKF
ncbi:hypothetical protein IQ247_16175 [Plectonema cf. radiosum LEGE 06105]|uniref:Type II secretion system protein GspC N-terminal domain-containing protein n=1 Tax=Plectonema cf. radiosum LEGE 06105 TaxID=945769 RepID=A0A8J7JTT4_9CYAN|nr:hypothetical protein [Plectonema radiosum]MBE9214184.1 hypothetical protein [Plectonema cf. radiosum LEGE 06105]